MELALVFALQIIGLAAAGALARPLFGVDAPASVRRVAAAVARATRGFALRALGRALGLAFFAALGVALLALSGGHGERGFAALAGAVAGAVLASVVALLGQAVANRATSAVVVAAHARFDHALTTSLRASGALGLTSQALGVLGSLGAVGIAFLVGGADALVPGHGGALAALPGYALGAALVGAMVAASSGVYAASARAGELAATLADTGVQRNEAQNPALVSAIVGEHLERAAGAVRLFALASAGSAVAILLALGDGSEMATFSRRAAVPLLLWAFGLVANAAGLFAARALEAEGAAPALARGQASVAAVWLFGLVGAGYWLLPEVWPPLAGAAALGLTGGALVPWSLVRGARRQGGALREALDALRGGAAPAQASSFGFGLLHAALGLAVLAGVVLGARALGALADVKHAPETALVLAFFGASAWSPYAFGVESSAALAETARRVATLGGSDPDVLMRAQRLVDSQATSSAIARCHASFTAGLAALAATLTVIAAPSSSTPGAETWVTLAGVAWTLAVAGGAAQRAARGARETNLEAYRQLASGPSEAPGEARAPSYRGCEEAAGGAGLEGTLGTALGILVLPVVLGIALKLVYRESGPRLAAEAPATFVAGAAVTALGVALTVDGARAVSAGARRANRPEGDPATYAASVTGDALSDIFRSAVSPAACTLALVAASLVLLARTIF
ncbi:MAG TPA: sodium/proton-translocating pyrophosphatase [Polyangiaceae bacterium]|nr:sodium/proton-translocating pyrophosphatase [Polyangiaceae bacterium]